MADFDPNTPLKGTVPQGGLSQMNPLQLMSGLADIQAKSNQNALFQQQFAAREAMGPIFQKAIDPATGDWDPKKVVQGLSNSREAAFMAPEVMQALAQRQLTMAQEHLAKAGIEEKDLLNARAFNQNFGTGLVGLMGSNFTKKGLDNFVANSLAQITDKEGRAKFATMAATALSEVGLPENAEDPRSVEAWRGKVRAAVQPFLANSQATQQAIDVTLGVMKQQNVGEGLLTTRSDPLTGKVYDAGGPSAYLPVELSPAERVQTHPVVTKDVQGREAPGFITSGQLEAELGGGTSRRTQSPATRQGLPEAGGVVGGTGLKPIQSGLSPAEAASQQHQESTAHDYRVDYQGAVDSLLPIVKRINAMEEAASKFETGGGTMFRQQVSQLVQSVPGLDRETANKLTDRIMRSGTNPDGSLKDGLAASQIFMIHAAPEAIQALKQAAQGTGRVMKSEVDTFLASIDINKDPSAVQQYINFTRDLGKTYVDKLDKLRQFEQGVKTGEPAFKGYSKHDFPAWYASHAMSGMLEPADKVLKNRAPADKAKPKRSLEEHFGGR